jgi:hypothetical protein
LEALSFSDTDASVSANWLMVLRERDDRHVPVTVDDGNPGVMRAMPEAGDGRVGADGLLAAWRRSRSHVAFAVLAVLVVYWWLVMIKLGTPKDWAFDFQQFWQGGNDVVNGVSPYPTAAQLETVRTEFHPVAIQEDFRFPYPAAAAVALAPFGALGFDTAAAVWGLLLIASIFGSLMLLGVSDWRVYALIACSQPVISSVRLGQVTPILLVLAVCAWRWRDRRWIAGAALGVAIALKIFLWPLLVWMLATRRYGAAGIAVALAGLATLGAWALIGFAGLAEYPELVRRLTEVVAEGSMSLVGLGTELGLPPELADAMPYLVGIPMLAAAYLVARKPDGDRRAFSLALVACMALTPIVWQHYFALLVAPLALARPRLAWPWAVLLVFWVIPTQGNEGDLWRVALSVAAVAVVLAVVARQRRPVAV